MEEIGRLGGKPKQVITLPTWLVKVGAWFLKIVHDVKELESGLEPVAFIDLQTKNTFINPNVSKTTLHYNDKEFSPGVNRYRTCML